MVHAALDHPLQDWAAGMDNRAELSGELEIAEGELRRVNANPVGLVHRACGLLVHHMIGV